METDYKALYEKIKPQLDRTYVENLSLREDLRIANAKLEGDPCTIGIYRENKINRQKTALRNLQRRVRVQRLQLSMINKLERGLRPEEWQALKQEHSAELEDIDFEYNK